MSELNNKELAIQFLKLTSTGQIDEAFLKYVDLNFIHHNQHFNGDRESLKIAMVESHLKMPNKKLQVKMILEDNDKIITCSEVNIPEPDLKIAVIHILKFEKNKIIEMWDVGEVIAKESPNENGVF